MLTATVRLVPALLTVLALLGAASPPAAQEPRDNPNIRFGMPSRANADTDRRQGFTFTYVWSSSAT
jgi:hypothetical protein